VGKITPRSAREFVQGESMIRSIVSTLALTAAAALGIAAPAAATDVRTEVTAGCNKVFYELDSDETTAVHTYSFKLDGQTIQFGAIYAGQSVTRLAFPAFGHHTARIVMDGTVVATDSSGTCAGNSEGVRFPRR
jgi:opacity protein-like surface antigen